MLEKAPVKITKVYKQIVSIRPKYGPRGTTTWENVINKTFPNTLHGRHSSVYIYQGDVVHRYNIQGDTRDDEGRNIILSKIDALWIRPTKNNGFSIEVVSRTEGHFNVAESTLFEIAEYWDIPPSILSKFDPNNKVVHTSFYRIPN